MKRMLAWFAGLVGIAALGRWLAGRSKAKPAPAAPEPEPAATVEEPEGNPAEELRRKLAETRSSEAVPAEEPVEESVDQRRARVHAQTRETIEAMADDGGSS